MSSWEELRLLVQSAGSSVEQALGLKDHPHVEEQSATSFREGLVVQGVAEQPLQFLLPDPSDLEVFGVPEPREDPVVLPPFLSLSACLLPEYIPPPSLDVEVAPESQERTHQVFPEPREQSTPMAAEASSSQREHTSSSQPGSRKRRREPSESTESDVGVIESPELIDLTQD